MRAALAALLFASTAAHAEGASWTELRTAHFVVRTDLSTDDARKYIVELEHMRDALFRGSWHGPTPPPGHMLVTLLADRSEMAEFASSTFAGFAAANAFGERMLVFSADHNPSELPVLKHELAHWLNGAFLLRQPRWLNEGLACYLETARTNSAEGTVVIGEPDPNRRDHLLTFPTDYARVLATGRELFMAPKEEILDFYAASWLLVHWLADEQRPRFNQYLGRLAKAQEPKAAWNAVFPELDGARLDKDVHAYLMRRRFGIGRIAAPPWEGPVEVRPTRAAHEAPRDRPTRASPARARAVRRRYARRRAPRGPRARRTIGARGCDRSQQSRLVPRHAWPFCRWPAAGIPFRADLAG